MPIFWIAIGGPEDVYGPDALKAALAEFFSTLIFVFAGEGSGMAFSKLTDDGSTTPAGLVAAALAHGFGLFVAVSAAFRNGDGHVNPAVTFGAFVGGHITLLRGILYWVAQLLGSTVACLLLKFASHGMTTSAFALSSGVTVWNAFVLEIVMTFGLVYTVYATAIDPRERLEINQAYTVYATAIDPNGERLEIIHLSKKEKLKIIAPIAIGFIVAANILAGGAFDGASMNPAMSFGPALVSWDWTNHWVYWAGPLVGGGLAGLVYQFCFISTSDVPSTSHVPLPTTE